MADRVTIGSSDTVAAINELLTRQPEEIIVFPYQIYQALSDQRMHELSAEARHHEMVAAARHARTEQATSQSQLRHAAARTLALLGFRRGAGSDSRMRTRAAGPMGCSA